MASKAKLYVRQGDKVKVLNGKDKGTVAEIVRTFPSEGRVVVKGVALVKKSVRPTQSNPRGGIITKEAKIDASRVQLVCPKCGKPTRVNFVRGEHGEKVLGEDKKRIRVCKKCGAQF